jgi:hypothetical protein
LLLYDPDSVREYSAAQGEFMRAIMAGDYSVTRVQLDTVNVLVYREKDLAEIVEEIEKVEELARDFSILAFKPDAPGASAIRSRLLAEPQIQEELRRIRERSRSAP